MDRDTLDNGSKSTFELGGDILEDITESCLVTLYVKNLHTLDTE
jgi:hypothetical protein